MGDPALVWTQSLKVLTQSPKVLLLTMERGPLMPMLMLSMDMLGMVMDIHMLMELMLTELFLLVPALVWTQSPRELLLTTERGLLMLMLSMLDIHMHMLDTHMLMDMFHSEAALELTQSPKVWIQSLKDLSTKRRVKTGG